jgi:hypothetical protein
LKQRDTAKPFQKTVPAPGTRVEENTSIRMITRGRTTSLSPALFVFCFYCEGCFIKKNYGMMIKLFAKTNTYVYSS